MPQADTHSFRAKLRMYRQGFGDCFLLTLPREGGDPFFMLLDFGVLGKQLRKGVLDEVIRDIIEVTGGKLDVVTATHEHWDHLSGFLEPRIKDLEVQEVWLSWAEDPEDEVAGKLFQEYGKVSLGLVQAQARLDLTGQSESARRMGQVLELFAASKKLGKTTADALEIVRGLADEAQGVRYLRPDEAPVMVAGVPARFFVLGPPRDAGRIREDDFDEGEGYGLAARRAFLEFILPGIQGDDQSAPFDEQYRIPVEAAKQLPFFRCRYWGSEIDAQTRDPELSWRRMDGAWLEYCLGMALKQSQMINNTSLVLAVEIDGGDVILLAADAQAGNWRSWPGLQWTGEDGVAITAQDLLRRTVCYKVGHHGSSNATRKEQGLDLMEALDFALLTVAKDKDGDLYYDLPQESLAQELTDKTNGRLIRVDEAIPAIAEGDVAKGPEGLYYELTLR